MQIIVNYKRNDNKHIPPHPPLITRIEPPYYTVGQSLGCAAVFLIILAAMLAMWAS